MGGFHGRSRGKEMGVCLEKERNQERGGGRTCLGRIKTIRVLCHGIQI